MDERLRRVIPVAVGLTTFVVSLAVLRVEQRAVSWNQLTTAITATPASSLVLAMVLTALNYAALVGYDLLAFAYIGKTRRFWPMPSPTTLASPCSPGHPSDIASTRAGA